MELRAVGDISTGIGINWRYEYLDKHNTDVVLNPADSLLTQEVRTELNQANILFGNLEGIITNSFFDLIEEQEGPNYELRSRLVCPPETVDLLDSCGFNVINLSNNHILDYGENFLIETIEYLENKDIEYIGNPLEDEKGKDVDFNGQTVQMAGFNLRSEPTDSIDQLRETAQKMGRSSKASIISIHWGEEHILSPSPNQIELGREIIDLGVDIVLGHHTHTFQPVEKYKDGIIAYSLGNFIFHQWRPMNIESGILKVGFDSQSATPIDNVQVFPTENKRGSVYFTDNPRIRNSVTTEINIPDKQEYQAEADKRIKRYQQDVFKEYLLNIYRFHPFSTMKRFHAWGERYLR